MGASGLGQLLVEEGLLQEFDRRTIRRTSGNQACAFAKGVIALGLFDEDQLAGFLTEFTKFDRVPKDLSDIVDLDTFAAVDPNLIMRLEVVPLMTEGRHLTVAIADPLDRTTIRQLEFFTGYKVRPMIATNQQIISTIQKLIPSFEPEITPLQKFLTNHVDAAAYHRRVRDMADPEIKFDTPQAAETVNFESPRTDDNEFEELTIEDDDEFHLTVDSANDETELDLSGLDSIEGDDLDAQLSPDTSSDDESGLELSSDQEEMQLTADGTSDNQIDSEETEEAHQAEGAGPSDQIELEMDAAADDVNAEPAVEEGELPDQLDEITGTESEVSADADLLTELDDQIKASPEENASAEESADGIDDILNAPVADLDSNAQAPVTDDDIQANDVLLEARSEDEASPTEETDVSQLVAETMEVTEEDEEDESKPPKAASGSTESAEPATADDLTDILSDLDDQEPYEHEDEDEQAAPPAVEKAAPTLDNLRAVADTAITDLNRAMVSLNTSTSKEDVCQVFCRAVGSSIPMGALLVDQGGVIEPICSWAEYGEQLSWEGFDLPDPSVLTLTQLEASTWTKQELDGVNLSDDQAYLVHLVAVRDIRLYMIGQPPAEISESIRRHVSRMLKAVAKRL